MKELIKVKEDNGKQLVSARELYLGLGLNVANWKRWYETSIENNEFFKENVDWISIRHNDENSKGGRPTKDFIITLDFAKHIAMMARTEKSHEYRNYFIECEKKLKEQNIKKLPQNYLEALKELVASEEARIKAEEERDKLIHQGKLYNTCEIAKELGYRSARQLNKILEEKGIQYKNNGTWLLKADYSELGYTSTKQLVLDNGHITYDRKWTGIGRDFILNLFGKGGNDNE